MKEYVIFDIRNGLLSHETVVKANSPMEAVKKNGYKNVKRDYTNRGDIVVSGSNCKYIYYGDKKC